LKNKKKKRIRPKIDDIELLKNCTKTFRIQNNIFFLQFGCGGYIEY
jgi:hypothetical protein